MTLGGISIGESLPAVVSAYGTPALASADGSGNHFAWSDARGTLRCTVGEDGRVNAIDDAPRAGSPLRIGLDGGSVVVAFGRLTAAEADTRLGIDAEYASSTTRTYRLEPDRELVLSFNAPHGVLERAIYGERLALLRAGFLPDDPRAPVFPFAPARAPGGVPAAAASDEPAAIVRVELDRAGIARTAAIVVSSGDAAFDETVRGRAENDRYTPATLAGRPIGSTLYREYPR